MNDMRNRPIVVGVDGSDCARLAVRWAARAAVRHGAAMQLVAVVNTFAFGAAESIAAAPDMLNDMQKKASHDLREAAKIVAEASDEIIVDLHTPIGGPVPILRDYSQTALMVVVGTRGLGAFASMALGSTASGLAAHCACPMVVVREVGQGAPSANAPVVVGVDGSKASECALGAAFDEAARLRAPLVAVHAWSDIPLPHDGSRRWAAGGEDTEAKARFVLNDMLRGWRDRYPDVEVRSVVAWDRPVRYLVEHAVDAQLMVVGSHGRGGFSGMLLGSTSQALLHVAPCPLMITRATKD